MKGARPKEPKTMIVLTPATPPTSTPEQPMVAPVMSCTSRTVCTVDEAVWGSVVHRLLPNQVQGVVMICDMGGTVYTIPLPRLKDLIDPRKQMQKWKEQVL
jgi:hypothetical protein